MELKLLKHLIHIKTKIGKKDLALGFWLDIPI